MRFTTGMINGLLLSIIPLALAVGGQLITADEAMQVYIIVGLSSGVANLVKKDIDDEF